MEYGKEDVQKRIDNRKIIKQEYGKLFEEVSSILFKKDIIGIYAEENTDEYDPEAGTIIPRLKDCKNEADVNTVVWEEFSKWFGQDIAGPKERYKSVSAEIWKAWQNFSNKR